MPEHTPTDAETVATAALLFEAGALRNQPRTGWPYDGVPVSATETVAEHSHRTAVIGVALAAMEGADPARTALLCTLHDLHETRIGDQTPVTRRYVTTADSRKVTADQVTGTPRPSRSTITAAVEEFEAGETLEKARCARDADKLDCLYGLWSTGRSATARDGKIERCRAALKTASARSLADAATVMDPAQWQRALPRCIGRTLSCPHLFQPIRLVRNRHPPPGGGDAGALPQSSGPATFRRCRTDSIDAPSVVLGRHASDGRAPQHPTGSRSAITPTAITVRTLMRVARAPAASAVIGRIPVVSHRLVCWTRERSRAGLV